MNHYELKFLSGTYVYLTFVCGHFICVVMTKIHYTRFPVTSPSVTSP